MTTEDKLEKIKKLADAMYCAAGNLGPNVGSGERLRKTMKQYHQFIVNDYHEEDPVSDDLEEEIKKYMDKNIVGNSSHRKDFEIWGGYIARHFAAWQRLQYIKIFKELYELANHQDGCYALECIQMRLDSLIDEE